MFAGQDVDLRHPAPEIEKHKPTPHALASKDPKRFTDPRCPFEGRQLGLPDVGEGVQWERERFALLEGGVGFVAGKKFEVLQDEGDDEVGKLRELSTGVGGRRPVFGECGHFRLLEGICGALRAGYVIERTQLR